MSVAVPEPPTLPQASANGWDARRAALKRGPAEKAARAALPGAVALWMASEAFHVTHVPAVDVALGTAALGALLYARMARKAHKRADPDKRLRHARQVFTGILMAGGWLALADWRGPLAGQYCWASLLWLAAATWGLRWLHRHETVTAAKQWRLRRLAFLGDAHVLGIPGAHMISHEETRLGEAFELDTTGTGRRSSSLAGRDLEERIAERRGLPHGRVHATDPRPGRLRVSIQDRDPWAHPVPHPLTDGAPEIELPAVCSIRDPLPVGQDPNTGKPLHAVLWDERGAKTMAIVGKKDAGKTTLLNAIRERVTACEDALLVDVNVSSAVEDLEWQPACYESAVTSRQERKAIAILDWLCEVVATRGRLGRDTFTLEPTPDRPAIICVLDEIGVLMKVPGAAERLRYLFSQNRKEGVALIIAGQRGVAAWLGGSDVRSLIDIVCIGRVGSQSEANHAAGDLEIPNISAYGDGRSGVWLIGEREAGGRYEIGRAFNLSAQADVRQIAWDRRDRTVKLEAGLPQRPGVLVTAGGGASETPSEPAPEPSTPPPGDAMQQWDAEHGSLDDTLGPNERERLASLDARRAENARMASENDAAIARLDAIPPGQLDALASAKAAEEARKTMIDDSLRERLLRLVAGEGRSGRALVDELGEKRHKIMAWMNRLRLEGLAVSTGKGKDGRYKITTEGERWLDQHAA